LSRATAFIWSAGRRSSETRGGGGMRRRSQTDTGKSRVKKRGGSVMGEAAEDGVPDSDILEVVLDFKKHQETGKEADLIR